MQLQGMVCYLLKMTHSKCSYGACVLFTMEIVDTAMYLPKMTHSKCSYRACVLSTEAQQMQLQGMCGIYWRLHSKCSYRVCVLSTEDDTQQMQLRGMCYLLKMPQQMQLQGMCAINWRCHTANAATGHVCYLLKMTQSIQLQGILVCHYLRALLKFQYLVHRKDPGRSTPSWVQTSFVACMGEYWPINTEINCSAIVYRQERGRIPVWFLTSQEAGGFLGPSCLFPVQAF